MKTTPLLVLAVLMMASSWAYAQNIEGRYWVNNQRHKPVVISHYQEQDYYVLLPRNAEGFVRFTDPTTLKGLWAKLKPRRKRSVQGAYTAVKQPDGSLAVRVITDTKQWTERWVPAPKEAP